MAERSATAGILLGTCYVRPNAYGGHFRSSVKIPAHRKHHCKDNGTAAQSLGLHDSRRLGTHGNTEKLG